MRLQDFRTRLEEIFDMKIDKILICVLSKEEFSHFKTTEWMVGFAFPRRHTVFVVEESASTRSNDEWLKIIKHEIVHVFYESKFHSILPYWLNEGMACYLSGQQNSRTEISIKDLMKYHNSSDKGIYDIGYTAVRLMLGGKEYDKTEKSD